MNYSLPYTVEVGGREYVIRTDYRAVLDIFDVLSDPEYSDREKAWQALHIFYFDPGVEDIPPEHQKEAIEKCVWFLDGGEDVRDTRSRPPLMSWQQDFPRIAAPVSRVYGSDIRAIPYDPGTNQGGLHWWTFLSAFMEIGGDCLFSQIVRIRGMKIRGKKLDKQDKEFYSRNRHLIDIKVQYTEAEKAFFKSLGV